MDDIVFAAYKYYRIVCFCVEELIIYAKVIIHSYSQLASFIDVVLEFNGVVAVLLNIISMQVSPTPLLNLFLAFDTLLASCSLGSYR